MDDLKLRIIDGIAVPRNCTHHAKWIAETSVLAHDHYIMNKLAPYVKPGMTVVDAGGHIGTHCVQYSRWVGDTGRVICFEPNPEAFECLEYNLRARKNVTLHNLGLAKEDKKLGMVNNPENIGANHLEGEGNIPCIRLDNLHLKSLGFFKIDCEGMEVEIMEGARHTIQAHKPVLFIEVNRGALARQGFTPEDIYNKLITFGYSYRNITDGEGLTGEQFDIICIPNP